MKVKIDCFIPSPRLYVSVIMELTVHYYIIRSSTIPQMISCCVLENRLHAGQNGLRCPLTF